MKDDCVIPTIGAHRGVGLHDYQSEGRLAVVRSEIDAVLDTIDDVAALVDWAGDAAHSPESRLLAEQKVLATFRAAADAREVRPIVDLERLGALTAGLASQKWRSPRCYGSIFDEVRGKPVRRERSLTDADIGC